MSSVFHLLLKASLHSWADNSALLFCHSLDLHFCSGVMLLFKRKCHLYKFWRGKSDLSPGYNTPSAQEWYQRYSPFLVGHTEVIHVKIPLLFLSWQITNAHIRAEVSIFKIMNEFFYNLSLCLELASSFGNQRSYNKQMFTLSALNVHLQYTFKCTGPNIQYVILSNQNSY